MKDSGKIYGFVGVIGSGKSYRADQLLEKCKAEGRTVVMGDFSEGIRRFAMGILTGNPQYVDILSKEYSDWKNSSFVVPLPLKDCGEVVLTGRQILKNIGEGFKQAFGPDIWAGWTENHVIDLISKIAPDMTDRELNDMTVLFGSIRFPYEAAVLFRLAEQLHREVEIIFCNYKSPVYELSHHISEEFARKFLEMGYNDGDNIAEEVRKIVQL